MIDFILRPFRRNFGKDKRYYRAVDDMFGFIAHNIELYKLALIHKSASVMYNGTQINNERLEYLGDAVLECVTSEFLYIEFPNKNEGFMTQLRSKMVSRQTLNEVAKRIGLDDYVITHSSNNLSQKHIYGDAFEAMVGAIYLDQGYDFVNRLLINHIFVKYIKVDELLVEETDFKSRLIEWCQKNHHTIQFKTENDRTYSSSHPFFYSKVLIDGMEVGYGAGDSKKEAEQRASYSVSQGFSEADYTKIMDKLDSIDGATAKGESKGKTKPKRKANVEPQPKADVEPQIDIKTEPKHEPKQEVKTEPKPKVPRKPKPKTVVEEIKLEVEPKPEEAKSAEHNPSESVEQKPKRVRKPRAKKGDISTPAAEPTEEVKADSKSDVKAKAESKSENSSEPNTESKAKPSRRPRRRPQSKSEPAVKTESIEIDSAV